MRVVIAMVVAMVVAMAFPAASDAKVLPAQPGGVPSLSVAPVSAKRAIAARSAVAEAKAALKAKKMTVAMAKLRSALYSDPGHVLARYTLASILAATGNADGLTLLQQLRTNGCRVCLGLVKHARRAKPWRKLRKDARFVAATKGVKIKKLRLKAEATKLKKGLVAGSLPGLDQMFRPRGSVVIRVYRSECMQQGENCSTVEHETATVYGLAGLQAWLTAHNAIAKNKHATFMKIVSGKRVRCTRRGTCNVSGKKVAYETRLVDSIRFKRGPSKLWSLSELHFRDSGDDD